MKIFNCINHFTVDEIACPCCGLCNINPKSMSRLDLLRDNLGSPLKINSACRCYEHNMEIGGSLHSSHCCSIDDISFAFDVACVDARLKYEIVKQAISVGFHRIGVYKTFIHLDDDLTKPPSVWTV